MSTDFVDHSGATEASMTTQVAGLSTSSAMPGSEDEFSNQGNVNDVLADENGDAEGEDENEDLDEDEDNQDEAEDSGPTSESESEDEHNPTCEHCANEQEKSRLRPRIAIMQPDIEDLRKTQEALLRTITDEGARRKLLEIGGNLERMDGVLAEFKRRLGELEEGW